MEQNTLGIMLSYYRMKYELTLEQVCDGICSTTTLHRTESGMRQIDSLLGECLLGRIGKEANQFELMLDEQDYSCWQVRKQILDAIKKKDYVEAEREITVYKKMSVELPGVHRQFCLYNQAILAIEKQEKKEIVWNLLSKAFFCSKSKIGKKQLYNSMEISIALKLIHFRYPEWKHCSKTIIDELLFVVEQYYTGHQKEDILTEIWMEIIYLIEEQGDDRSLIIYIDQAIEAIAKGRRMRYLGDLHFKKAQVMEKCYHNTKEWYVQEDNCKKECLMAYYIFDVTKKEREREAIKVFCEEKMGWLITAQEMLLD